jgi:hypothetical protein
MKNCNDENCCNNTITTDTYNKGVILPENYFKVSLSPKIARDSSQRFKVEVGMCRLMEFIEIASKEYDIRVLS